MFRSFVLTSCLALLAILSCNPIAWSQVLLPQSVNGQFRTNTDGWNPTNGNATVVQSSAGNGRLKLDGAVGLWQVLPVSGIADFQLINCQAFKRLKAGASAANSGWAGIGVNYYDIGWGFIDSFETQINVSDSQDIFGDTKLLPCSLGVPTPAGAAHAIIWVANDDANSEVFVDNLFLFDYILPSAAIAPRADGTYPGTLADLDGQVHETSGLEFWNVQGSIDTGRGTIGAAGTPSAISQEFKLTPGSDYTIYWYTTSYRSTTAPTANIGVDFYDANWVRIGGGYSQIVPNSLGNNSGQHIAEVPNQTVHSIVWVWVDSLTANDGNQQLGPIQLNVQPINTSGPTVTLYRPVLNRSPGDIGLEVLLDYVDDRAGVPNVFIFEMQLIGPSEAPYQIGWELLADDEDPKHWTIKLTVFSPSVQPIDWSLEPTGTYTLNIPTDSIRDENNNAMISPLTVTFQNQPAAAR